MIYENAAFDHLISRYDFGNPRNKYYLDVNKLVAVAYGTFNTDSMRYIVSPSNKYKAKMIERLSTDILVDKSTRYTPIRHFINVLKLQNSYNAFLKEFLDIADKIDLTAKLVIPIFKEKSATDTEAEVFEMMMKNKTDPKKIDNAIDNIAKFDNYNSIILESHAKVVESNNKVLDALIEHKKLSNHNVSYVLDRLIAARKQLYGIDAEALKGYMIISDDYPEIIRRLFSSDVTDELYEMIDKCIVDGYMVLVGPEDDEMIKNATKDSNVRTYNICSNFRKIVSAYAGDDPVQINYTRNNKEVPCYLIAVNNKVVITNADSKMLTSSLGTYDIAQKWRL